MGLCLVTLFLLWDLILQFHCFRTCLSASHLYLVVTCFIGFIFCVIYIYIIYLLKSFDFIFFQTADLTNANLEGANLEGANLKVNIPFIRLPTVCYSVWYFYGKMVVMLPRLSIWTIQLDGWDKANCWTIYLIGEASFAYYYCYIHQGAILTNANLKGANLQRAYLRDVNLRDTVSRMKFKFRHCIHFI